jgi:hypothetical protein
MDYTQIIAFLAVLVLTVLKAITMKPCANHLPSQHTPLFLSFWVTITLICFLPFYYKELIHDINVNTFALGFAFIKGIFFFEYVNIGQKLSKETGSSRVFMGAVACGIIAFVNVFLFQEELTQYQLISAVLITLLGLIYYFKGHLSETSAGTHKAFLIMLVLAVILSVFDHLGLSNLHWFTFLFFSIPVMLLISFFKNRNDESISMKFFFDKKILFLAASVYIITEIVLTQIRVTILPVTVVNIAVLMTLPIVMMLMTVIWKESTLKKQAFFGLSAFAIGLLALL